MACSGRVIDRPMASTTSATTSATTAIAATIQVAGFLAGGGGGLQGLGVDRLDPLGQGGDHRLDAGIERRHPALDVGDGGRGVDPGEEVALIGVELAVHRLPGRLRQRLGLDQRRNSAAAVFIWATYLASRRSMKSFSWRRSVSIAAFSDGEATSASRFSTAWIEVRSRPSRPLFWSSPSVWRAAASSLNWAT